MVADLNPIRFSFDMEGGAFFRVKSHLDNSPKFFQDVFLMAWGIVLRRSDLSALKILFMEWLKKVRFDFADIINGLLPELE